jgi:hypothetical protein
MIQDHRTGDLEIVLERGHETDRSARGESDRPGHDALLEFSKGIEKQNAVGGRG